MSDRIEVIQRISEGLALSCPFNIPVNGCLLNPYRSLSLEEITDKIKQIEIKSLVSILNQHSGCFAKRINQYDIASINSKTRYLKWNCETNIDVLSFELKKRNWIKSQNEFLMLFSPDIMNKNRAKWNYSKKEELAYLLFCMRKSGIFIPVGAKGYFRYIEDHITGYNNEMFTKNQLKKLSSAIKNNPEKHRRTIACVHEIMKLI